jgi:hypothetical protein
VLDNDTAETLGREFSRKNIAFYSEVIRLVLPSAGG